MKRSLLSLCLMVQVLSFLFVLGLSLDAQRSTKPKAGKQTTKPANKKPDTASITGSLKNGSNDDGRPVRGTIFGVKTTGRSDNGKVHIVYVLDVSGSMRRLNREGVSRISKVQEALKQALSELKKTDTFNVVLFAGTPEIFSSNMLPATQENILKAVNYVDNVELRDGTNFSSAMEAALSTEGKITHVFLLSDGEPMSGIRDPAQLRAFITKQNTQKAAIITLALGFGEDFPGIPLLKSIAEDNHGKFSYVNLVK